MATIKQAFNKGKVYIGWYGVCPETGENACVPFDLINAENEHTILPETGSFSGDGIGKSKLINQIHAFENTNQVGYSGDVVTKLGNSFQQTKQLTCGEAYVIYVLPGTDEDNLLSVDIPEFVIGNIESDEKESEEYILTTGCGVAPTTTPTPTTPECVTSPVTITVESEYIGPGNSEYKYITSDSSGAGGLFGCIDVARGSTLTISVTGEYADLVEHPIKITEPRTDVVRTDTGGQNNDGTYTLTWVVPCDETVDKYQYQCEDHAHMRGTINVIGTECPTTTPSPTPVLDCCDASLNNVNVVAEQVTEFGSPRVVASGFSYSGELCCGNGSVGTPNSVNLYVNGYTPSVGVISFAGQLDSNEIYLKVTDDPFSTNGVPVMTGECLKGIVNGDECILEIQ
jgi:hypothetical protein